MIFPTELNIYHAPAISEDVLGIRRFICLTITGISHGGVVLSNNFYMVGILEAFRRLSARADGLMRIPLYPGFVFSGLTCLVYRVVLDCLFRKPSSRDLNLTCGKFPNLDALLH